MNIVNTSVSRKIPKINIIDNKNKNINPFYRINTSLFLNKILKNSDSSEQNSIISTKHSKEKIESYNNLLSDFPSINSRKRVLPKLNISPHFSNLPINNYSYINSNSTSNIISNINKPKSKCKIIKIVKKDKSSSGSFSNKVFLNNSLSPNIKLTTEINLFEKLSVNKNKILFNNLKHKNNRNNHKTSNSKSKSNSPQQKLFIDCFHTEKFILNKIRGYTRAGTFNSGKTKINQDSYIILNNIFKLNFDILAIMDGHGMNGHLVSQYLKKKIIKTFTKEETFNLTKKYRSEIMEDFIYQNLTRNNFSLIKNIFNIFDKDLQKENFNSNISGSTLNILFHISKYLICANTGDSRCILIKKNNNNNIKENKINFKYENLSNDHKPNNPEEKKRITNNGGIVRQSKNSKGKLGGVYRIFLKEKSYPGLAISRTIGDFDSKLIGNISEPDIKVKVIDDNFISVVLGSDGLWDVINGDDVINEIYHLIEKNNLDEIAENLVNNAIFSWKNESFERDDISIIVGFFNYNRWNTEKNKDKKS